MKPAPFEYLDPPDLDGVLAALAEHGDDALVIGGGQSLVPLLNMRLARPEVVVDPRRVPGLDAITVTDTALVVGARVTATTLIEHAGARSLLPGLVAATADIGHVQIRNRTTIGGSIAHADPAAELPAVLLALDGQVVLHSAAAERSVGADDFFLGAFVTARRPDELVTAVHFPLPHDVASSRTGWLEQSRRPGDFALVGVFVSLAWDGDGVTTSAAIALSGLGSRPVRASAAEAGLVGTRLTPDAIESAAEAVRGAVEPIDDLHASAAHRSALAGVLTARLLIRLSTEDRP